MLAVRNLMAAIVHRITCGDTLAVIEGQELVDGVRHRLRDDDENPLVAVTMASLAQLEHVLAVIYGVNDPATVPAYASDVAHAYADRGGRNVSRLAGHVVVQLAPPQPLGLALTE